MTEKKTLNVLGTEYEIRVLKYDEHPDFASNHCDGECDGINKEILICDMSTWPDWSERDRKDAKTVTRSQKRTLRHEIIHAFFNESGLMDSSAHFDGPWAQFEEMVDWWATQGPKIMEAWKAVGAL